MSSGRLKTMSFTALLKAGVFDDDDRLAVAPDQAVEVTVEILEGPVPTRVVGESHDVDEILMISAKVGRLSARTGGCRAR